MEKTYSKTSFPSRFGLYLPAGAGAFVVVVIIYSGLEF